MAITDKIKQYFFHKSIQKETSTSRQSKSSHITFDKAKSIAIVFDASDLKNRDVVEKYSKGLEKKGKTVALLGYVQGKGELDNYSFPCYNDKNINWSSCVSGDAFSAFKDQKYDVLISAWPNSNPHLEYVAATVSATIKAGAMPNLIAPFDVMLDVNTNTPIKNFLQQIEALLHKVTK